jgi:glycerate 2-kinase
MSGTAASDHDPLAAQMRLTARQLFEHSLAEASVDRAFERHLDCERGVLRVHQDLYDLNSFSRVLVVALGKAAHSMVRAFEARAGERFEGIVASSVEPASQARNFRYFRGGHPQPNLDSIRAADAILKSLSALPASSLVLYLLSGGGSSMVEKPIDDEISLDDLVRTYRTLVLSGAPIGEINVIRRHLSAVKGGRLAQAAHPARQVSLLVSDVPEGEPAALASGPTMPDPSRVDDCYRIAAAYGLLDEFPDSVRELFEGHALEETPKAEDRAFERSRWWTISSNADVLAACRSEAERRGFVAEVDNRCDDWDYMAAVDYLLERLRSLRNGSARVCLISGGEVTVKVTGSGAGGRNQQFALASARKIAGENIAVLSAGTDGIDGNSTADGAVADGTTLARASAKGLDPEAHLTHFNAFPFFAALGDAVITGPTGNNLRDLRILMSW